MRRVKAVVAFTKSARTLRTLPFQILPVCDASSCTNPEDQARAHIFAQRRSAAHQGATWWSKKAFEGVPAERRQLLDALLRGADHGSGHTGQRHGCRRDRVVAYGQRQCVYTVTEQTAANRRSHQTAEPEQMPGSADADGAVFFYLRVTGPPLASGDNVSKAYAWALDTSMST